MAEVFKKLFGRVQSVEGGKGIEGVNYEYLCIQPDVELPEGYKPPNFEMFDGTGDPKAHLRTYCDKLIGAEKAPDVFYIQNLKKKPTKTFRVYATRWRSKAAKCRERLMVIENCKCSDIIRLGERIEEGIKSGMVTNFEALQATNKALQS
nr:uncharacterized protein LOC117278169 [Nicotiana tomentosiformis]